MPFARSIIARVGFCLMAAVGLSAETKADVNGWQVYEDAIWGYTVAYPAYLFDQPQIDEGQGGLTLSSLDGSALFLLFAGPNKFQLDPEGLASELSLAPEIRDVTYRRVARDWLVLSGYLADGPLGASGNIFYERVEFSPDGSSMAGFRLEYPPTQRQVFRPPDWENRTITYPPTLRSAFGRASLLLAGAAN